MSSDPELEISVNDVHQKMQTTPLNEKTWLLLDCRELSEYETASIGGSVLIPMNEIPTRSSEINDFQDKQVVVFCHAGVRSSQVVQWMRQNGFAQAQTMAGGIDAWSKEVDPQVPLF